MNFRLNDSQKTFIICIEYYYYCFRVTTVTDAQCRKHLIEAPYLPWKKPSSFSSPAPYNMIFRLKYRFAVCTRDLEWKITHHSPVVYQLGGQWSHREDNSQRRNTPKRQLNKPWKGFKLMEEDNYNKWRLKRSLKLMEAAVLVLLMSQQLSDFPSRTCTVQWLLLAQHLGCHLEWKGKECS